MIAIAAFFLLQAQENAELARGAKVFAQSCAVGYCHGSAGAANRGPRLAGRGFDRPYVDKVIREGVPGTAMPGFKTMPPVDLNAVIAYVSLISGGGAVSAVPPHQPSATPPKFSGSAQAKKGKDLFFDATRGTRCGTCHSVEDWGTPVGPNLAAKPPSSGAAIRAVKAQNVRTALTPLGERFPALAVQRTATRIQVYDLTTTPPVLRSFAAGEVTLEAGSTWRHETAIQSYSGADLDAIAAYLGEKGKDH